MIVFTVFRNFFLPGNADEMRVVSLGTGTKCIGKSKLSANGKNEEIYVLEL